MLKYFPKFWEASGWKRIRAAADHHNLGPGHRLICALTLEPLLQAALPAKRRARPVHRDREHARKAQLPLGANLTKGPVFSSVHRI